MHTDQPRPGPHLHAHSLTTAEAAPDTQRPRFRELAKLHAAAASDYLLAAGTCGDLIDREELLTLADIAANVSIACSHVAPAARFRYVHRTEDDK